MDKFAIEGGRALQGEVDVLGVKNGLLPMMAAALLASAGETILHNVPALSDVDTMAKVLEGLGARVRHDHATRTLVLDCTSLSSHVAPYEYVKQMRASFLVMGPLLGRIHQAEVSQPGGCSIGVRSINLHLEGLHKLGATISEDNGNVLASTTGLTGTDIYFDTPTHTGTENIMMAACLAAGTTTIVNAACEPEIADLAALLNMMGARISGAGTPLIAIEGVGRLHGVEYTVMPSRIETAFFLAACAVSGGELIINHARLEHIGIVVDKMQQMGITLRGLSGGRVLVKRKGRMRAVNFSTRPYPGFPTDFQAQMMVLQAISRGTSIIEETIFENRFRHVPELVRMGANIESTYSKAVVIGGESLCGCPVMASDLQAGAGLVIAALAAEGASTVDRVYHIDRGYELLDVRLASLGAAITRVKS